MLFRSDDRSARFRTVITLLIKDNDPIYFEGSVEGVIALTENGSAGFGYDPIFIPNGFSRTFAEMTPIEKNSISHRAKAVAKLINYLNNLRTTHFE